MKNLVRFITATVFLSLALTPTAVAQNLSPAQLAMSSSVASSQDPITAVPFEFDPNKTDLVRARWMTGIGCPTGATVAPYMGSPYSFTDAACPSGDPKDKQNEGLLLVKTGPTPNFASAGADLKGVKGITLNELGYDIRTGSHCGAGAPRFNVTDTSGTIHFVGCSSPAPSSSTTGGSLGWTRLRWNAAALAMAFPPITPLTVVQSITIIFDEGQDASGGPDSSGLAIIDNIDVNTVLVGKGPGS